MKSREQKFFYGHPQNRFWKVMAGVCGCPVPGTIDEKKAFLAQNHIALWDTIHSCTITGSSDSSIRDVVPNDLTPILDKADIREIYCNGGTSYRLYEKYLRQQTGREAVKSFCLCNAYKYLWRHKNKNGLEDLKKARWYLDRYITMQTEDDKTIRAEIERICKGDSE